MLYQHSFEHSATHQRHPPNEQQWHKDSKLRELQRAGGHYIAGERLNKSSAEEAISQAGRYKELRSNLHIKEIVVGEGEARIRYVLVRNPEQAKRDREKREGVVKEIERELQGLKRLPKDQHTKAVCALIAHKTYGRYLKLDKKGWPKLDRVKCFRHPITSKS